ncbi:alpha-glucosidase AglA [Candidatus Caldatribacterium saccharofermentans]|uniref:alpha-glucosidase AglA n=1 Tax=Candidatus Caldatribacterium saccharofermentans TaxID=1454753 RepID=UPI003D07D4DA
MKVAIIGAGSVRFALQLVGDLAKTSELSGTLVTLMDINEERLNATWILAQKYVQELDADLRLEVVPSLPQALEGADFVINTAAPSYPDRYDLVTAIGEKHGYYRGIDSQEFNMVSTYSYVLCSYYDLQLALNIAHSMEKFCPHAWLLQTANPVLEITQLLSKYTQVKAVGFCHGFSGVYEVFRTLGLEAQAVDWQVAGVNHGIWLNRFRVQGEDAYPLLECWIAEKSHLWEPSNPWDVQLSPAVIDMYRFYGMLPIGDTCRNGTWKYNYNLETKKKWYGKFGGIDNEVERPRFHEELRQSKQKLVDLAQEVKKDSSLKLTKVYPELFSREKLSGEQHIPFISAITGHTETRLILNIPNQGAIQGIPDDIIVEIPVWVSGDCLRREPLQPDLTERIKYMYLLPRILRMHWALEAFLSKDKRVLEEILVRDPRTRSFEQVQEVLQDIMSLPVNKEMAEYFGYS